jgi:hypothetical protein
MSGADGKKRERKSLRDFGLTVGIAFAVLAALLYWREKAHYVYFIPAGAVLILLGLVVPIALRPIRKGWMTLAAGMGWVMTRVILTILFFGVLTPIGVIGRLVGKDFLHVDIDESAQSYWVRKEAVEGARGGMKDGQTRYRTGVLRISQTPEEMVAHADYRPSGSARRFDSPYRRFGPGSIHLRALLEAEENRRLARTLRIPTAHPAPLPPPCC